MSSSTKNHPQQHDDNPPSSPPPFLPTSSIQVCAVAEDAVSAVCILPKTPKSLLPSTTTLDNNGDNDDSDSSVSSEDFFLSRQQNCTQSGNIISRHDNGADDDSVVMVTGQTNGASWIWKGPHRRQALTPPRGGSCLTIRRAGPKRVLLHTKDPAGTVSFHNLDDSAAVVVDVIPTHARTFCAAVPWDDHRTVMPTAEDTVVQVHDGRVGQTLVFAATPENSYGCLTSLAAVDHVVACGMESGHVVYHDIRHTARPLCLAGVQLGQQRHPVLALDLVRKPNNHFVTAAGLAGTEDERDTLFWVTHQCEQQAWQSKVRPPLSTSRTGKSGVACLRLLSDRHMAVGGWDGRLRVFRKHQLVALGRGHGAHTIQCLDHNGSNLIATGGSDGRVLLWDCRRVL